MGPVASLEQLIPTSGPKLRTAAGVSARFMSKITMDHGNPWAGLGRVQVSIPRGGGSLAEHGGEMGTGGSAHPAALGDSCTFPVLRAQAGLDVLNCPKVAVPEPGATCRRDCGQEPDTDTSHSGSTPGVRKLQRTRTQTRCTSPQVIRGRARFQLTA